MESLTSKRSKFWRFKNQNTDFGNFIIIIPILEILYFQQSPNFEKAEKSKSKKSSKIEIQKFIGDKIQKFLKMNSPKIQFFSIVEYWQSKKQVLTPLWEIKTLVVSLHSICYTVNFSHGLSSAEKHSNDFANYFTKCFLRVFLGCV